jgi:DNA-binding NarL/FixJ family response regulator
MGRSIIRILLVDDYAPWRRFVRLTLQVQDKLKIIGEVGDGMEAVAQAQELQPDLILLDVGLPTLNGIEAARQIREVSPASKILFLTQARSADIAKEALTTGACGYVVKSDGASELLSGIRSVLAGKRFISASLAAKNLTDSKEEQVRYHRNVEPLREADGKATHRHTVNYFRNDSAFVDGFAVFIGATLRGGNPVVVLATESHRASIVRKLNQEGVDVGSAVEGKLLTALDVADSLPMFRLAEHLTEEKAAQGNLQVGVG